MPKIRKVLVANRGEIAIRVMRTCKELGIATVAVYSEADRSALHVRTADQAIFVGPPPSRESYLVQQRILDAAKQAGADAIHPGYGFLSENAAFVRACDAAGLTFIGPPASAMDSMGEKTRARANMIKAGVPVVPGTTEPVASVEEARAYVEKIGFPVMLKAAGGGGGKGMRKVERMEDFESSWRAAKSEALNAFGNDAVYIEKYLEKPHHVEIQVFADQYGNTIHLNERECSAQRRHQKVVEETPSPILTPELRAKMGEVAVKAAKAVNYVGAGTVEFLVDVHRNFYFLEMNTRLQVEHPVTEWVTGLDLVAMQIKAAEGEKLGLTEAPTPRGHSIEVRVYAEDPSRNFMPSPGKITYLRVPGGPNVRDDSGVFPGYTVPNVYDPMISKLSVWAPTRREAIARTQRALSEYVVKGITTNIRYLKAILAHPEFIEGDYDTSFLTRQHDALLGAEDPKLSEMALLASVVHTYQKDQKRAKTLPSASGGQGGGNGGVSPWKQALRARR
ncbi:acetyl-CoA carboxylase biotin carboxylase subunit [Myxococcus xanthus]|uniref:Acetyl-CoA carboxylase biotin carboxylase subunit n=1 Tax=Myxococcus xanthus TaxID=34 RepID=A0AAE6FX21_MYXXA|nr:acetyl-CoA carboxylase biotin carboxylase subunit [Myxococcus xanthus]QDE66541.1 acetyl-CoA carboxylase biotin carboxylase subunit [Myxococcus xanthus]QDE73814.1 acetyl-CoA carboxylase biotin carboxylase subunit [Myxococcus xanthus]QDE81075.1 acetyl-CoA carboxylase biotin carboxylase subunit [Myxococcus xanthus]